MFPEMPKGYHNGTGDLLYIDPYIIKERKMRRKNVVMALIDNKKAYWKIDCLKMYKISDNVIGEIMKNCSAELIAERKKCFQRWKYR